MPERKTPTAAQSRPRPKPARPRVASPRGQHFLLKASAGIRGFDELTGGGLPWGRPSLVCGGPGCGKTLFATEFLVRGALEHGEPGVFMAFEETPEELAANVASLGFDLPRMEKKGQLIIDHVHLAASEIEESGSYDLEGLFIRLGHAVDTIGAKRVVLDTLENLFGNLQNTTLLRSELRRLFGWLKDRKLTAVITAERGSNALTRQGLEEYVSDCVILLDHRINESVSTRRMRIVKYRGTVHGTDEYPFLIDADGFSIFPVTSLRLDHRVSQEIISTGVKRLDELFEPGGMYRGSSVLLSGVAGTGKTTFAAHLADAACKRGEKVIFFAHEESPAQLVRNMKSVGIDLGRWVKKDMLRIAASRPYQCGLEMHLVSAHKLVRDFAPSVVIVDPVSDFIVSSNARESHAMLTRLVDFFKKEGLTAMFTSLTHHQDWREQTNVGLSSLIDTWITLQAPQSGGERHRLLAIIKSRGMSHSNQLSEYVITPRGIKLRDAYLGTGKVLVGTARSIQEVKTASRIKSQIREADHEMNILENKKRSVDARIAAIRSEYDLAESRLMRRVERKRERGQQMQQERERTAQGRWSFKSQHEGKTP